MLAARLPIRLIPKQHFITLVRHAMIDNRCNHRASIALAITPRMIGQPFFALTIPFHAIQSL